MKLLEKMKLIDKIMVGYIKKYFYKNRNGYLWIFFLRIKWLIKLILDNLYLIGLSLFKL